MMSNPVLRKIYQHPDLGFEDLERVCRAHSTFEFNKGDYFLEKGKLANEYYIIDTGLVRAYTHDYKGDEITTGFIGTHEILIEVASLFQRIPSQENLQALTDGVAFKIDFENFQEIYHQSRGFNEWGRAWMAQQLFSIKQRHIDSVRISASDRYLKLLKERPQVIQYDSLKHISSFLGITDTSLSRIRKNIVQD